jgi:hypothetical protein
MRSPHFSGYTPHHGHRHLDQPSAPAHKRAAVLDPEKYLDVVDTREGIRPGRPPVGEVRPIAAYRQSVALHESISDFKGTTILFAPVGEQPRHEDRDTIAIGSARDMRRFTRALHRTKGAT